MAAAQPTNGGSEGDLLSPSGLLKRIHALEREAAERERRDAAIVAGLRRDVADLEARLLEAMASSYDPTQHRLSHSSPHRAPRDPSRSRPSSRDGSPSPPPAGAAELAPERSASRLRLAQREEKLLLDRTGFEVKVRELEATLSAWEQRLRTQEDDLVTAKIKFEAAQKEAMERIAREKKELQQRADKLRRQELECKAILESIPSKRVGGGTVGGAGAASRGSVTSTSSSGSSSVPPPPAFAKARTATHKDANTKDAMTDAAPPAAHQTTPSANLTDQLAAIDAEIESYDRSLQAAHHGKLGALAKRSFFVRAQAQLNLNQRTSQ